MSLPDILYALNWGRLAILIGCVLSLWMRQSKIEPKYIVAFFLAVSLVMNIIALGIGTWGRWVSLL